jgi:hypothetical protein
MQDATVAYCAPGALHPIIQFTLFWLKVRIFAVNYCSLIDARTVAQAQKPA